MKRDALLHALNEWLQPERFRDVAENGLQVEGRDDVQTVVCGVSANRALIEAAIEAEADAIFVHHGIIWGGGIRSLKGWLKERVRLLLEHEISLFAYHLPLDAHPLLGNNAGLASALGVHPEGRAPFGDYKGQAIGVQGTVDEGTSFGALVNRHRAQVGEPLVAFGDVERSVRSVGLCSGGAPDLLYEAIDKDLDVYVTGEVTEWVQAVAQESGVCFIAGGHHQTERFGASRVAAKLSDDLGLKARFIDVENPA